ncbi:MAG: hypothetical protein JWP26_461 [Devosia sp.]|nr:hypothetical protein [Devosia sp.]
MRTFEHPEWMVKVVDGVILLPLLGVEHAAEHRFGTTLR